MAQQNLNVGTTANDGTGDTLRASQIKVQSNFDELYARPDFTDAPSDGNTYGRKDGTWEQVTGGSGTTPTLNEVVTEGNEIINTAGNLKLVLDKEDNGIFLYELVSSVWEERGYYNSQGFTLGGFDGTPTFDLNIYTETLSIYQGTDIIQFSPTSATKNSVEFATEDYALKRDGSNANSDVDLGAFGLTAKRIKSVNTAYPDGFMDINPDSKIATIGDINNALFGTKLVISDGTGEIDFAITDTENFRVNGQKIITTPDLATFKTTEYLDATSSIQGQFDSKQNKMSWISSSSPYTGTTSTALQKLTNAGSSGNGSFPAKANTRYKIEIQFQLSGLSTTTNYVQFGILGTAGITYVNGQSLACKSATLISSNTPSYTALNTATISAALMTTGTQAFARANINIEVVTSTAGTLIIAFATNVSTTPVVENHIIRFIELGASSTTASSDIV